VRQTSDTNEPRRAQEMAKVLEVLECPHVDTKNFTGKFYQMFMGKQLNLR
jgi:hypothetical protein